jgi:hypothetical protein
LLQPLDVKIFRPLKNWHQDDILQTIQYRDIPEYSRVDFLNGFQKMRDKTFKFATIRHAQKEAGLAPFNSEIVLKKMRGFLPLSPSIQPLTEPPKTAERKPFQHPPSTQDRPTHRRDLDQRPEDQCSQ